MSLAASPIQTSDMPRRPLRKQHSQAHGNAVLGENSPKNNALEAWFLSQTTLTDPPNGRLISKTTLTDPPNGRLILKTTLTDPPKGHLILKTALTDPLNGHQILKASLADPLNGRLILKAALTDPLNGHRILKTALSDGSEAGFSRKTTKTIPAFRLRFIPARHATKSRLPGNAFHSSLPLHKRIIGV